MLFHAMNKYKMLILVIFVVFTCQLMCSCKNGERKAAVKIAKINNFAVDKFFDPVKFDGGADVSSEWTMSPEIDISRIPAGLIDSYFHLIDPSNQLVVGTNCGYSGEETEGIKAIRALAGANRLDLIRSVLKCKNPGARVYAAQALMEMKRNGTKLTNDDEATIEKIKKLKIPLEVCYGCIGRNQTALEILGDKKHSPFQGDTILGVKAYLGSSGVDYIK